MASVDDIETNTKFAESLEADFPLLSNEEKDIAEAYGVVSAVRPLPAGSVEDLRGPVHSGSGYLH